MDRTTRGCRTGPPRERGAIPGAAGQSVGVPRADGAGAGRGWANARCHTGVGGRAEE
jgi:hypothetical protein